MKIRKILGVVILLIFVLGVILVFVYKEEIENTKFRYFVTPLSFLFIFTGFELIWPSKKKNKKD